MNNHACIPSTRNFCPPQWGACHGAATGWPAEAERCACRVQAGGGRRGLVWVLAVAVAGGASAAVVNVDIQPASGVRMVGTEGTVLPAGPYWNVNGQDHEWQPLLTGGGNDSGLRMMTDLWDLRYPATGNALERDGMIGTVTISGLTPGIPYEVVFYGVAGVQTLYRIGQPFTRLDPPQPPDWPPGSNGVYGVGDARHLHGLVTPDSTGSFELSVNLGILAGLQVATPNPEPGVAMLLGIGGLAAWRRRRC